MEKPQKTTQLGTLWIAATTLGDLKDIPLRSLELLRSCHLLIFEEDKRARQFLKTAQVHRQWMRYTEQREAFTLEELEKELRSGNDAIYMSDQGTPGLADPGLDLVKLAYRLGAPVRCVPGPSALTAAISVCPFDCRRFEFAGFPPRDSEERQVFLRWRLDTPWPIIIFETPYRMRAFFETLAAVLQGSQRQIFIALDISGPNEKFFLARADDVVSKISNITEKLNFVVIVEGTGIESRKARPRQKSHRATETQVSQPGRENRGPKHGENKRSKSRHHRGQSRQ